MKIIENAKNESLEFSILDFYKKFKEIRFKNARKFKSFKKENVSFEC